MPVDQQPVYDLTVDEAHEFFADGVLVHNCGWDPTENWSPDRLDALVWAVTALQPWRRRARAGAGTPGVTMPGVPVGTPISRGGI